MKVLEQKRPLPTLIQWIDQQNGGERAPDFDAFKALSDLAERTIAVPDNGLPENEACFLRLWKGFLIATVELCNVERLKCGVPVETVVAMLPRAMASVASEDAPLRQIAKVLTEEFRAAAKVAADGLMERGSNERG